MPVCPLLRFSVILKRQIAAAGVEKLCRDLQVDPSDRKVRNIKCLPTIAISLVQADLHLLLAWAAFRLIRWFHCKLHRVSSSCAGSFAGLEDGSTANGFLLQIRIRARWANLQVNTHRGVPQPEYIATVYSGLQLLSAHDLPTLKSSLNQVAIKVDNDPDVFQSFYQFAFKFCLTVSLVTTLVVYASTCAHACAHAQYLTQLDNGLSIVCSDMTGFVADALLSLSCMCCRNPGRRS